MYILRILLIIVIIYGKIFFGDLREGFYVLSELRKSMS